jgi:hypothetical protein
VDPSLAGRLHFDIAKRRIFQGFEYDDDMPQPA